jgi:cytochrome bd ubiquinol oxidase subunit II
MEGLLAFPLEAVFLGLWILGDLRRLGAGRAVAGVAFANIVRGVPLNAAQVYTGNLMTPLNPYGLLGGLVIGTLFTLHGAIFLSLKTTGEIRHRARTAALRLAPAVVLLTAGFLVISQVTHGKLAGQP